MSISWMYLINEVKLLLKGTFLSEKFQQDIESEDDSFATVRGQGFFANQPSVTNDS